MEGLGSVIASAFEAARAATESLQVAVTYKALVSTDATGEKVFGGPVSRMALVQEGKRIVTTQDGRTVPIRAIVTFFPEADGEEPPAIGPHDMIVLPSGNSGPIVEVKDTLAAALGAVFVRTVWLA
jgi:hypothetical protein